MQASSTLPQQQQHGWLGRSSAWLTLLWVLPLPGFLFLSCFCSTIYNMCTQKPPYDYSEQLYQRYKDAFNTYINDMVGGAQFCAGPNLTWLGLAAPPASTQTHAAALPGPLTWQPKPVPAQHTAQSTGQRAPGQDAAQSC